MGNKRYGKVAFFTSNIFAVQENSATTAAANKPFGLGKAPQC